MSTRGGRSSSNPKSARSRVFENLLLGFCLSVGDAPTDTMNVQEVEESFTAIVEHLRLDQGKLVQFRQGTGGVSVLHYWEAGEAADSSTESDGVCFSDDQSTSLDRGAAESRANGSVFFASGPSGAGSLRQSVHLRTWAQVEHSGAIAGGWRHCRWAGSSVRSKTKYAGRLRR